jgi:predicted enzyme related to lactoylglutathione lyase
MSVRHESWPTGTPAWVDLAVPDLATAREFYGALLGWEFWEGAPETGFYTTCVKNGEPAAALGTPMAGDGTPPAWTVYLATDDAAATAAAIASAGGTLLLAPTQVMEFGTMAIFADPTGAVAGLWQSGSHTGANIVDEAGAVRWNEEMTRDLPAAKDFFARVFGYTYTDMSADGFEYDTFELDGVTRGGLGSIPPFMGPEVPPHWLTYFGVEDADAAVAVVAAHGGSVVRPPWDTPFGRMALVQGPFGEAFAVMAGGSPGPGV